VCGAILALAALMIALPTALGAAGVDDLAGPLREIAIRAQRGEPLPQMAPAEVQGPGQQVLVVVRFKSEMAAAAQPLTAYGARVRFRRGTRVEAFIPADRLLEVANLPEVAQVEPATFVRPAQGYGASASESLQVIGATSFHRAGYFGQGVRVAIMDLGFGDIDNREFPAGANMVSFRVDGTMGTDTHGTQVAEIVADFAPLADFTLIAVDTVLAVEAATEYVANEAFDVCSVSLGTPGGPYDGTASICRAIERARDAGVFWVNAAGNDAQSHWQGQWVDRDRDGVLEFAPGDEGIDIMLGPWGSYLGPGVYDFHLTWYQSAGALTNHDYDLVLYDALGAEVARSGWTQNGDDPPHDVLQAFIDTAATYTLQVEHVAGPDDPNEQFQLFCGGALLEAAHQVPESSLDTMAASRGAYVVGAVRGPVTDVLGFPMLAMDELEEFSSQGPVVGHPEIIKPDLVAHDGVTTSFTDATTPHFMGTSAATPHVAGAAALLMSEDQLREPEEIETLLRAQAVRLGDPIPNNEFGWGRLHMRVGTDGRPPAITITYPQNGTTITTRTPTIVAFITDDGSGVDPTTITVELNGLIVFDGSQVADITDFWDDRTGQFTYPLDEQLARSNHNAVINVQDNVGNAADPGITSFRVAAPTIPGGVSIVSFPYRDLQVTAPDVILGTPLSDLALVRWWPLDTSFDKYHFYPDARASLVPPDCQQADLDDRTVPYPPAGLGYFMSIPRDAVLDIQGQPLTDVPSTHIRVYHGQQPPRGWNLIGNPYAEPISWGAVQIETDGQRLDLREAISTGVTEGVLFEYVQGVGGQAGFYDFNPDPTVAMMKPMTGYWFHVNQDAKVIIYSANVGSMADAEEQVIEADDGWLLTLCARAGEYQDPRNIIGVKSTASAGYDPQWDVPEPPPMLDALEMSMPRPGWGDHAGRYARDVRGTGEAAGWDVEVCCTLPDREVEVTWPQLNAEVPADTRLMLEDLDTGQTLYMRTSTGYRFRTGPDGAVRHLRISTLDGNRSLTVEGMAAQAIGGGGAMITYSVSRSAEVAAEVRNIAGRLVRRFPARAVDGGTQQTLVWNGISDRGSAVPSGRYIVRLTALAADGQTVQAIRPFSITR